MLFQRIERELADGEPWDFLSVNRMEWGSERQDYETIKSREKPTFDHGLLMPNFRFWQNWAFWKRLFPVKQVVQNNPFTK